MNYATDSQSRQPQQKAPSSRTSWVLGSYVLSRRAVALSGLILNVCVWSDAGRGYTHTGYRRYQLMP